MANYEIPENPQYNKQIRKIDPLDYGHANVVNQVYGQIVENCEYLKKENEALRDEFDNILDEETISMAQENGFLEEEDVTMEEEGTIPQYPIVN